MEAQHKARLKAIVLNLRHILEGRSDAAGVRQPGDLEVRLAALGIRADRPPVPLDQIPHLTAEDRNARQVVDAFLESHRKNGIGPEEALSEFTRESAYTWANRLLALRCMEARGLIDEIILQKENYGGRSLQHHRLARQNPERCADEDGGLYAALMDEFARRAIELPLLFDPQAPAIALKPGIAALKECIRLLSASDELFTAPDALGWAYQYWNTEEKDRVFERVRTVKGAKIEKLDIIPVTQLYTEPYMVKFLVQNSLGALWMAMHPESRLCDAWEYFGRDADRPPVPTKPVRKISFLDPCTGSGHFLLEAFDLLYAMYEEEGELKTPATICEAILSRNLFGIDIDERSVQIAALALTMKAKEKAPDFMPTRINLTAANIHPANGPDRLTAFLEKHPEDKPLQKALTTVFESLAHADELGALLQIEEPVEKELRFLKTLDDQEKTDQDQTVLPLKEFDTTEQQRLPLGVESYEDWKTGLLGRLKAHFQEETASTDLSIRFFGQAAGKGLSLFDFLSRRYDVVATNPPYMGSKNMGAIVKRYIETHFSQGKRDLYAAFILRCLELARLETGRVAMVTQQSWMFLRAFTELRALDEDKLKKATGFKGILRDTSIETLAHLGAGAFGEISGEVVNTVLFTLAKHIPDDEHRLTAFRLIGPKSPEEKDTLLRHSIKNSESSIISLPIQGIFLKIPLSPLCYWLRKNFFTLLVGNSLLKDITVISEGAGTRFEQWFVRMFWECPFIHNNRWHPYTKGGGFSKWCGLDYWQVDWQYEGVRPRAYITAKFPYLKGNIGILIRDEQFYGQPGLSYTDVACGSLSVRITDKTICSDQGPGIYPIECSRYVIAAILNARLHSYILRALTPSPMHFRKGYLYNLPLPQSFSDDCFAKLEYLVNLIILLKNSIISNIPYEYLFEIHHEIESPNKADTMQQISAILLLLEGYTEFFIFDQYGLDDQDCEAILSETGTPAGWFSLIHGYDSLPPFSRGIPEIPTEVLYFLSKHEPRILGANALTSLRLRLRSLYEAGPGVKEETDGSSAETENDDDEESEQLASGARIPIPAETLLEELSQKLEIHPISVYWLLKEGIEKEGWRCLPEEQRLMRDRFSVLILRLLGHRWPKQIEAGDALPVWADGDGIIPLTEGSNEATLHERLRERLAAECGNEQVSMEENAFTGVMGKPLKEWVGKDFFRHHCSQFRKRPIAWQVTSAQENGYRRQDSALEVMIYYHRVDGDLLPKLRSQHLGPLQKRFERELHGLEKTPGRTLSAEEENRRNLLRSHVGELKAFDETLSNVIAEGFAPASIKPLLRQNALNDAMLCLKSRWLRRLCETIAAGPLAEWKMAAGRTELHPELSAWIAEAMGHLDHHCTAVGPGSPEQASLSVDPTAAELAAMIEAELEAMVPATLTCACDVWWRPFDRNVLKPLAEQIRDAKKEQNTLKDRARESSVSAKERMAMADRLDALKREIKAWQEELNQKTGKGQALREAIRTWRCPEALTWGNWLAEQAMYDQVSSLDGKRPPPRMIQEFILQEGAYQPDVNDGVRVNIAPLQRAGILTADVLAAKDVEKAIADRAAWRDDERRWCREGKLPKPGWWD
jgi:hypothetical protein